jgi:RNA polymerase subunit RPABC4/transcription elongation factor Spt4
MPKGWTIPEQVGMVCDNSPVLNRMPLPTKLSRFMATPKIYKYAIKKIEMFEVDTGRNLHPKNLQYITISPIEANYSILLSSTEQGFPLPLRNVVEIKEISTNIVEFDFWGTGTVGVTGVGSIGVKDRKYIATIKTGERYTPQLPILLKELKTLENDSAYWKCELLTFQGDRTIEIYSQTPFLAEGEQIIWQNPKSEFVDNRKQVNSIEVVTNFRIFQYDYTQHKGSVILFPSLENVIVTNQHHTMVTSSVGSYSDFSHKITGIKNIRTDSVVGDISFYVEGKPLINFKGITDPELLSSAVNKLKKQYDMLPTSKQQTEETTTELHCTKCTSINPGDSKFCNRCGSALSFNTILFDNSEYVGKLVVQHPELELIQRYQDLRQRIEEYKPAWDKDGVIQYKTEYIAILQRMWGMQVEFIIAFDDLTKEGYRLMAIDEGKSGGDSSGGFTGGVNAYFYFQNMKYVK